jgi:hypothetical protein
MRMARCAAEMRRIANAVTTPMIATTIINSSKEMPRSPLGLPGL